MLFVIPEALTTSTGTIGSITSAHSAAEAAADGVSLATVPPGLEVVSALVAATVHAHTAEAAAVVAPAIADQLAYGATHTTAAVAYTGMDAANKLAMLAL